jgi:organic radical activating enzyme
MGRRVGFVRFANCNLACEWCDTPYSWDWTRFDRDAETMLLDVPTLADVVNGMGVRRVVLTGGEPMMQQRYMPPLAAATPGVLYDVETNGTIAPRPDTVEAVDLFMVSPKLAHSGDPEALRLKAPALDAYASLARDGRAAFKWVVKSQRDVLEAEALSEALGVPMDAVWMMPEGANRHDHMTRLIALADFIVGTGANLSTRLHVLAWSDKRGV